MLKLFKPLSAKEQDVAVRMAERKARWFEIVRKGQAPLSEITEADFGTPNPNGLNIDHWCGDPIITFNITDKQKRFLGSLKSWEEPDTVQLHRVFNLLKDYGGYPLSQHAVNMFTHETIHSRQGFEMGLGLMALSGNFLHGFEPQHDGQQQYVDQVVRRTKFLSYGKYDLRTYLSESTEMQARLHEFLCVAYQEWQVMPTSSSELFAGMHHAGFRIPEDTLEFLQDDPQGQQALNRFQLSDYTRSQMRLPVGLINQVFDVAKVCDMDATVWEANTQYYYGHLLDLYGDVEGAQHMFPGLGRRIEGLRLLFDFKSGNVDEFNQASVDRIGRPFVPSFLTALKIQQKPPQMIAQFEDVFEQRDGGLPDWYPRVELA